MTEPSGPDEREDLLRRLAFAEQTLDAIRRGAVDALVVSTPDGPQIFTLQGADGFYRALVEQMGQGAAAVQRDGTVLYANAALARMMGLPLESLIGSDLTRHVEGDDRRRLLDLLAGGQPSGITDIELGHGPTRLQASVSVQQVAALDGTRTLCLLATDLTQFRLAEAAQQRAALADERARVARDLHDVVLQNLFLAGLRMTTLGRRLEPTETQDLHQIMDGLDVIVKDIRTTIFGLNQPFDGPGATAAIEELVSQDYGTPVQLSISGDVDALPAGTHVEVLAVLREALSNAVRHSGATIIQVQVRAYADEVVVRVVDDGSGLPAVRHERGLANLRARAAALNGRCTFTAPADGTGLAVTWTIPRPR